MPKLNARLKALVSLPTIETFYLVRVADMYTTSYFDDVTLSNGQTYLAGDYLKAVDPPRLSSSVDRQQYTIVLSDVESYVGQFAESGLVGRPAEVRVGFVDQATQQPELILENTLVLYRGRVDGTGYRSGTGEIGTNDFIVKCTSPMGNLDATKAYYTSKDFIQSIDPTDTAYDQLYEGAGKINLKWGRV